MTMDNDRVIKRFEENTRTSLQAKAQRILKKVQAKNRQEQGRGLND